MLLALAVAVAPGAGPVPVAGAQGALPVAFAASRSGSGFWVTFPDGAVGAYGDARHAGDMAGRMLNRPIVGMAATPSGKGYWLVADDGGIFAFGDARFHGSLGSIVLNRPIVGMAATPSGKGYWLVAGDGGVFSFGDARFHGSTGGIALNFPISGIAPSPTGRGYWLVAWDGGVFAFGDARFHGSLAGSARPHHVVVGIASDRASGGYVLVDAAGTSFAFGPQSASSRMTMLVGLVRGDTSWSVYSGAGAPAPVAGNPPAPSGAPAPAPAPAPGPMPAAAPRFISSDITDYVRLPGDQVVVVPNGRYHADEVVAPHPATTGAYRGWLVLKAETKHGVVVDLEGQQLLLDEGTSRVMFVGFRFVNGSISVAGSDITFWYTDHSFPAPVWRAQGPSTAPEDGYYRSPDAVHLYFSSNLRTRFLGSDIHDTCDGIDVTKSQHLLLQGVAMWDITDEDADPNDICHPDALDGVGGKSRGLTVRDSWIKGRVILIDAPGSLSGGGPHEGFLFASTWVSHSPSVGFTFTSRKPDDPRGIFGRRTGVRSWAHSAGIDRLEILGGEQHRDPNTNPGLINVVDSAVTTAAPPPGAPSPAAVWRALHPYDTWEQAVG